MSYNSVRFEVNAESRMQMMRDGITCNQFLALPTGTELVLINIAPFGVAVHAQGVTVDDKTRQNIIEIADENEIPYDERMPWDLVVYLLPEDWVPDVEEILTGSYRSLGERHGREGSPMFSSAMLKDKHGDIGWSEDSYTVYVKAYKAASNKRRGA